MKYSMLQLFAALTTFIVFDSFVKNKELTSIQQCVSTQKSLYIAKFGDTIIYASINALCLLFPQLLETFMMQNGRVTRVMTQWHTWARKCMLRWLYDWQNKHTGWNWKEAQNIQRSLKLERFNMVYKHIFSLIMHITGTMSLPIPRSIAEQTDGNKLHLPPQFGQ